MRRRPAGGSEQGGKAEQADEGKRGKGRGREGLILTGEDVTSSKVRKSKVLNQEHCCVPAVQATGG